MNKPPKPEPDFLPPLDKATMDAAWEGAMKLIRDQGGDPEALLAQAARNLPHRLPVPPMPRRRRR